MSFLCTTSTPVVCPEGNTSHDPGQLQSIHLYLHLSHLTHHDFPLNQSNLKICPYLHLLTKGVVQKASKQPWATPSPPTRRCKKCTSSSPICNPGKSADESISYPFPSENKWNQRTNARGVHVQCTQPSPHTSEIKSVVSGWSVCSLEGQNFLVNIFDNSILPKLTITAKLKTKQCARKRD